MHFKKRLMKGNKYCLLFETLHLNEEIDTELKIQLEEILNEIHLFL